MKNKINIINYKLENYNANHKYIEINTHSIKLLLQFINIAHMQANIFNNHNF